MKKIILPVKQKNLEKDKFKMKKSEDIYWGAWIFYQGNYYNVESYDQKGDNFRLFCKDLAEFPHVLDLNRNDFEILQVSPRQDSNEKSTRTQVCKIKN